MPEKTPKPRVRARNIIFPVLLLLLVAAALLFPRAREGWTRPLGPGLELPTRTATTAPSVTSVAAAETRPVTGTAALTLAAEATIDLVSSPTLRPTSTERPTATPQPYCGGPPEMVVLAVGADNRDDTYLYGLADVIRIVRVDFVTPKVTMLSLPRDLWVEIPEISDHYDITHGKLNQAYLYGGPGMGYYDGPGGGPGLLARTLDLNFGLAPDHYGAVNMQTFVKIVDAVGGLDIYLPRDVDGRPVDDKTEDMGYFTAGEHHFSGSEALRFARIRKKYSDFARMDNQNMVLCALKEKVTSPSVLPKIPQIIAAFQDSVQTDLSLGQLSQLACLLPYLDRENMIFTSLPQDVLEPARQYSPQQKDNTFILDVDPEIIRDYVQRFLAGEWPTEPDEPSCP